MKMEVSNRISTDKQTFKASTRYPAHYEDDISIRSDINENEIANYIQRAANSASNKEQMFTCSGNLGCDDDSTIEDCPQNQCYNQYIDPSQHDENKQRILFDKMQEILSTKISYCQEQTTTSKGSEGQTCNGSNPNACDTNITNENCPTKECYKNYIDDIKKTGDKTQNKSRVNVLSLSQNERSMPLERLSSSHSGIKEEGIRHDDYKTKYNTLVVNSDVSVPDFIDVLVVISENPIKITLPTLNGPNIESTVGKITKTSNLLIKNLSLCSHKIVANGNNKIDTVRTSVAVEPAGKKTLGAVHDTWILL
jgi:hypothetical protein